MRKVIFINSHPIQYFAPLYKYLCEHDVPTECWYGSDENVKGHLDRQFGAQVEWDVPLLEGYQSRFFRNYSLRPSLYNGFFGLINPGMIQALFREKPAVIVVHGWSYFTHVLVLIFARLRGHTVCLRGENPVNQELTKPGMLLMIKRLLLGSFLFQLVHTFLYIGKQNRAFYEYYGVAESRLAYAPYCVDNQRFGEAARDLVPRRADLKRELGLPPGVAVILFTAKFTEKKRPLDLIRAYAKLALPAKALVMVGDGELRGAMERMIKDESLSGVFMTGFVNQSMIARYYAVADVFVLCSGAGETWGLSVNEALNFDLPVVVSDLAGCGSDLVKEGKNGFVFKTGDHLEMAGRIADSIGLKRPSSSDVLDVHSFRTIALTLGELANRSVSR